jgi:predicted RNA-binding protein with RPS1 domain
MVQYVKYFESFIDIGKDIGMFHIHQISHARVTNMDGKLTAREKVKVNLN